MNNPDHISESLETICWFKILQFLDADPGWKIVGSGINIPDPQHCKRVVLKNGLLYLVMVVLALRDLAGHGLGLGVGPGSLLLLLLG
jgi:hypothetical protein